MTTTLAILLCIGSGTVGGVFFAFSSFVMKALAERPAVHGIGAMQRINIDVINPMFLCVFLGSAMISLFAVVLSIMTWSSADAPLLLAAGLFYLFGSFVVTIRYNVPRNERLSQLEAESVEANEYWPTYVREWTRWNHIRAAASIVAAACSAGALAI